MKNHDGQDAPLIELRDITREFVTRGRTATVLADINLSVRKGEFVGIIGKSGSGKSTLLNIITGIDRPTSGNVSVAGEAVHVMPENRLAAWRGRTVGVVFQFFQLLPALTVSENVMLPMDFVRSCPAGERRERALALLDRVGIAEHADKLPSALSGGQQQRAAIARALANDPPILVADEPTGNLDARSASAVISLFSDLAKEGKTIVIVTHERDVSAFTDRAVMLADGRVAAEFKGSREDAHA